MSALLYEWERAVGDPKQTIGCLATFVDERNYGWAALC